ncbi:MAG: phosphoribosylanthranilate isomerase [Spirochaetota bacterium]
MKVKICGITQFEDAAYAAEAGASILGFVFAASPRMVSPVQVREIIERLDARGLRAGIKCAGIFVNESPSVMESIIRDTGLDFAQIHGDDSASLTASYSFPWYRAMRVASPSDFDRLSPDGGSEWKCPIILADAYVKGIYGGTGRSISVDTAVYVKEKVHAAGKEFFVAGGIDSRNAAEFIKLIAPDGIDVSSGVEEAPGIKSKEKIKQLFEAII